MATTATERGERGERQLGLARAVLCDCGFRDAGDVRAACWAGGVRRAVRRLLRDCGFRTAAEVRAAVGRAR